MNQAETDVKVESSLAQDKLARLKQRLRQLEAAIVAYSGGIDSTFLTHVAREVLGGKLLAVTALSPSVSRHDRELAEQHTVMLSSHILPEVEATCRKIVIINHGAIVAAGTPDELRQRITGGSKLIAELRGPNEQVAAGIRELNGVSDVQTEAREGWTRVTITSAKDLRESIYTMSTQKGWPLRELRREVATLEDFFVKSVAAAREETVTPTV